MFNLFKTLFSPKTTFPLDPDSPHILLPVTLGGNGTTIETNLLLDTGASFCLVTPELADFLELPRQQKITFNTTSGQVKSHTSTIPLVSLGHKSVEDVKTIITELPDNSDIDGLLGLSFLKHCHLSLDFKAQQLTLR